MATTTVHGDKLASESMQRVDLNVDERNALIGILAKLLATESDSRPREFNSEAAYRAFKTFEWGG